jgi:hypothetical protein
VSLRTWGVNSSNDFSSDGTYTLIDLSSGQTFNTYIKSWNDKKSLITLIGRQQTPGSNFYYSNSWWSNRSKVQDIFAYANPYTNTNNNLVNEAFFRVPIQGAFVTSVTDVYNPSAWIEYSGTVENANSIGDGSDSIIPGGALTYSIKGGNSNSNGSWFSLYYYANGSDSLSGQGSYGYWGFNLRTAYASGSNSISRSRFGYTATVEQYLGPWYSASGFGFGADSDDQDGGLPSPGVIVSSGRTNARSNAGNSGIYENDYPFGLEFWIIPQNNWQYYIV